MFEKTHCVHDAGAEINTVRVIVTYSVVAFTSFTLWRRRLRFLTNDNYSDIRLYIIFHIEYKVVEFITNKKEPTITFPIRQYWNDNEAATANGGLVNKANRYVQ